MAGSRRTGTISRSPRSSKAVPPLPSIPGRALWSRAFMRILVLQESDWIERGPHQSHHLLERMALRGHDVRIIDFEIGWRNHPPVGIIARRQVFAAPPKVIQGAVITVVRPGGIRFPVLDYASSVVTHRFE